MPPLTIVVTGGRHYTDREHVRSALDRLHRERGIAWLAHGGATGADALADEWARDNGVQVQTFPVTRLDWKTSGRRAGPERNRRMLAWTKPDGVVAFPGGAGTADCCLAAAERGIPVWRPRLPESR